MALRKIRLELARCPEFPEGSAGHGYEFVAPLDSAGNFDAAEWRKARAKCTVRRFWGKDPAESGVLVHTGKGRWAFSYVPNETDDDEPIFQFDRHVFRQGEYVSITEHDGVQRPFRIATVG
ncbi:MAG: hypothetical protein IT562_04840 [Alphaproteobacteria bacterium]|nr:hypothetical protein [Alphaproteobacteria bacterium]